MHKTLDQLQTELLVMKCQAGDSRAFDALVQRWQRRVWQFAYRLLGREDEAWELTQESWIAVIQGIRQLQDPAAFPHWIFRIVSHKYLDWLRSRQRQRRLRERMEIEAQHYTPASATIDTSLSTALFALPAKTRLLLCLYYVEEFSIGEIAIILHIPEGTVKSRLYHARQQLQSLLGDHADG